MKQFLTALTRLALSGAALVLTAGAAHAACADLNNDGNVNTADLAILATCASGVCPAVTGGVCGTGNLIDCADVFGDGDVSVGAALTADVGSLGTFIAGGDPLYDICNGPGPDIACPGNTVTLGNPPTVISSSQTWPASCTVKIEGQVTVTTPINGPTTVLRVESGSIVKGIPGSTTANPAALVFQVGSRIDAQGTPSAPVIFTSDAAPGARSKEDWGGVVFNGRGTVNGPNCQFVSEGLPFSFGGCETDYHCGVAKFVRAEFGGLDFTANNELNAWTMNGCGTQTDMDFIQGHASADDCLEWFGGTSNHTNMIASACGDDGFDWQLGWTGSVQFGLMLQSGTLTDTGSDSRGIEGDGSEFDQNATPFSDPDMCNMTFVGGRNQPGANNGSDAGILLRRGTKAQIANAIVTSYGDNCLELRDATTTQRACVDADVNGIPESLTGDTFIRNSILENCGDIAGNPYEYAKDGDTLDGVAGADLAACGAAGCRCDSETFYNLLVSGFNVPNVNGVAPTVQANLAGGDQWPALDNAACTGLETPYVCCSGVGAGSCRAIYDGRPAPSGPAPAAFTCNNINPLFVNPSYLGAINPAASCSATGCDWMSKPWVEFALN